MQLSSLSNPSMKSMLQKEVSLVLKHKEQQRHKVPFNLISHLPKFQRKC
jgi:hypothetical protein